MVGTPNVIEQQLKADKTLLTLVLSLAAKAKAVALEYAGGHQTNIFIARGSTTALSRLLYKAPGPRACIEHCAFGASKLAAVCAANPSLQDHRNTLWHECK